MNKRTRRRDGALSWVRVGRGVTEASLAGLAFAFAILLIGMPIAVTVRGLHDALSWLVRLGGEMSAFVESLVSISSVAAGFVVAAIFARLLVRFLHWRRTLVFG